MIGSEASVPRPEWFIMGVPMGDGTVTVWASSDLIDASVKKVMAELRSWFEPSFIRPEHDHFVITIRSKTYVWVRGATYAEAIARLFQTWSPDDRPDPGVPELPATTWTDAQLRPDPPLPAPTTEGTE